MSQQTTIGSFSRHHSENHVVKDLTVWVQTPGFTFGVFLPGTGDDRDDRNPEGPGPFEEATLAAGVRVVSVVVVERCLESRI